MIERSCVFTLLILLDILVFPPSGEKGILGLAGRAGGVTKNENENGTE
jgi:hypothetical protein